MKNILLSALLFLLLASCKKNSITSPNPPPPNNNTCMLSGESSSLTGQPQTFEYDPKGLLTKVTMAYGLSSLYTPYVQTVTPFRVAGTYSKIGQFTINDLVVFDDSTQSVYDGMPAYAGFGDGGTGADSVIKIINYKDHYFLYGYDAKKRLTSVYINYRYTVNIDTFSNKKIVAGVTDSLVYDDKDNVIKILVINKYATFKYFPQQPSQNYWLFDQALRETFEIVYDEKPCPYTCMLNYYKFIRSDWGDYYTSNWLLIIAALSKNNPVKMHAYGRDLYLNAIDATYEYTYNYNEHGYPTERLSGGNTQETFTYQCK